MAVPAKDRPAGSLATDLQRQPLIRFAQDGTVSLVHPRGTVLRSSDTADVTTDRLRIAEEEVPRDGIVVRRSFQSTLPCHRSGCSAPSWRRRATSRHVLHLQPPTCPLAWAETRSIRCIRVADGVTRP